MKQITARAILSTLGVIACVYLLMLAAPLLFVSWLYDTAAGRPEKRT